MPQVSNPVDRDHSRSAPKPRRPLWIWALVGIAVGLLVALLLIIRGRNDYDFYRSSGVAPAAAGPGYAPLPVPGDEQPEITTAPQIPESLGTILSEGGSNDGAFVINDPSPTAAPPVQAPEPAAPTVPTTGERSLSALPEPLPNQPAPDYPADAYRNQESGTVRVRATVDASGNVIDSRLEVSSRSTSLDRAAVSTVRRWKFRPAVRNGQPMQSDVIVPVEFTLN